MPYKFTQSSFPLLAIAGRQKSRRRSIPRTGLRHISNRKSIGIIGRCDSEMSTPHLHFSLAQTDEYIRAGRLIWVIDGELARKTYLFDEVKKPQVKFRKTGEWIPIPSPPLPSDGIFKDGYFGPKNNVLQFV